MKNSMEKTTIKYMELPINKISGDEYKVKIKPILYKGRMESEGLKELAESIKKSGLLQPIIVYPEREETYQVLAGMRRLLAYKKFIKEEKTIMCGIMSKKLSSLELKLMTLSPPSTTRVQPSLQDHIDVCTELYKRYGSIKNVASLTGLSIKQVKEFLDLNKER
jgi:ParB family chromosome partitioning protein|tara:strand:+ start:2692 stop:3183 length:492 start_codon:yes stop_codon:yes gene_type:complete